MRRTRTSATREQIVAHIHGINRKGDVVIISVYQKGGGIRLSGPNGSHSVHQSNISNMQGWKREAALAWNLTNVIDIPIHLENSLDTKEKLEQLRINAKTLRDEQQSGG